MVEPGVRGGIRNYCSQYPMINTLTLKLYLTEATNRALPIASRLSMSTSFTRNCGSASGITTTVSDERTGVTLWGNIGEFQWFCGLGLGPRRKNFPDHRFRCHFGFHCGFRVLPATCS